ESGDQRQDVLRQLGLVERQEYQWHNYPAREEQRLAGRAVTPGLPGGAEVLQPRERRNYPREGCERHDRQIVPERRGPMEAPRRDPLERLAQEYVAREVRMPDRDDDEPGEGDRAEQREPTPREQSPHGCADGERVRDQREQRDCDGDRAFGEGAGRHRGPGGDGPLVGEPDDG